MHFQVLLMQQRAIKCWRKVKSIQEKIKFYFTNSKDLNKATQRDLEVIHSKVDKLNTGELEIWQSFIFARNEFMIHELVFDGIENYNSKTDFHKRRIFNRIMRDLGPYSPISAKTLFRYLDWEDANPNIDFADFDNVSTENDWEFDGAAIPTTKRKYGKDVSVLLHNVIGDIKNHGLAYQTYDYSTTYNANVAQFERFGNPTLWRDDESSKKVTELQSSNGDNLKSKNAYSLIPSIETVPVKNNYIPPSNDIYPEHISSDFTFGFVTENPDQNEAIGVGENKFKNCVFESKSSSDEIFSKLDGLLDEIRSTNNEIEELSFNLESSHDLSIISDSIHENLIEDTSSYKGLIVETEKHYYETAHLDDTLIQGFEDIPTSRCSRLTVTKSVNTLPKSFVSAKGLKSNSNDPRERMMNKDATIVIQINQSECYFAQSDTTTNFADYEIYKNSIDCSLRNISLNSTQTNTTRHAQEHIGIVPYECFQNISSKIMENELFSHIIVNNFPFVRLKCSEISDKINIEYSGNTFADRNDIGIQISEILPKDSIGYSTVDVIFEITQDSQKEAKVQKLQEQYPTLIWWVPSDHYGYINWKYKGQNEEEKQLIGTQLRKALKFYKSRAFFDSLF